MKKYFIHFFICGVVLAVILSDFMEINLLVFFVSLYLFLILFFSLFLLKLGQTSRKILVALIIIIFFFTLTLFRIEKTQIDSKLIQFEGQKINVTGKIVGEIDIRSFNNRIKVEVEKIETENLIINGSEKIILVTSHFPEYKTGDSINVYGKIQLPENFDNENGIEFDYINYLAKDSIYSMAYYPKINLVSRPDFNLERSIFGLKNSFLGKVQTIFPSPQSELLGGILLGTKRSLGEKLEEDFRTVGLIHIVVLSGYNVTIIAEFIFRILGFLPKYFSAGVGAFSIIIFSIMVGSGATVVRSTVMALLALVSRISNKNYNVNRALFFAGGIMILHNPQILLHDPSFQLSFLATIGLINLADFVKKFLKFLPEKFQIKEISTATLSTQIAVLPLLTKMTGELSVVAPIVNILTLQVIPITMLLGFIAGLIAFFNQTLGLIAGLLPFLFLSYILKIVEIFSSFSIATVRIGFF